ncbi:hypothetical protein AOA80_06010 [Methanomassiliicoccales archaeon RumEn M1]|jgi:NitT/TauT family transport system substrate-binding protein|nr:hypothetical protein AOA80_06010 [Methanomassiliicoccales archaeon RumEn M1]
MTYLEIRDLYDEPSRSPRYYMKRSTTIAIAIVVVAIIAVAGVMASGALQRDGIKYLDVPPAQHEEYLQSSLIDGAVSWEPYASECVHSGAAKVLIQSGEVWPDHPCCVLVANSNSEIGDDVMARVVKAHVEATNWILETIENKDSNPENYNALLNVASEFSDVSEEVVEMALQNMKLTYDITPETISYLETFTNEYLDAGLISKNRVQNVDEFVNSLVDLSYLERIDEVEPGAELTPVKIGYLQGDLHQLARVVASNIELPIDGNEEGRSLFMRYGINAEVPSGMPGGGYSNGGAVMVGHGNWDVAYLGSPPVILNVANQGHPVKILALANTEGSALIVAGDRTIEDLNGLTIGQPGTSSIQYLLLVAIAEEYGYRLTR